ncbi:MAG: MgtC/SapB family protein [Leptolyngbyaceae cyanobacterium RM1_406_9]|nr:MgtC/SapB family protein [Leptolyngbyaceae cyanobacterium RM1_406_9]
MDLTVILRLAIALAIGLIIGMERGWESRESPTGSRIAGIRSFGFVGLLGGLSAFLAAQVGASVLGITFIGLALIVAVSYGVTARKTQDFGITTELALLITFLLGALAGKGFTSEAVAAAVVMAVLLGFKQELHQSLQHLDRRELIATLQLLLIAAVVLPLLPDRNLGPWSALNPRAIGLLVVLIAGISYVGYFAMRLLGTRVGLLATAMLGALVSSTAVTVSFGRMARRGQGNLALLGAGISLAAGTMALRILIEVSVVNPALLPALVPPVALLAIVPLMAAGAIAIRTKATTSSSDVELRNPIELGAALGYGAVFAVLFILIQAVETWFGDAGIYALSAISGITDVDAVSLSLAQATQGDLPLQVGTTGILIAAMVNTIVKAVLATVIGGWKLARWCASILLLALGLSLTTAIFTSF